MRLTLERLYQARWSATIHEEWIRAVLRDRPHIPAARLHSLRDAMETHAQDAVVTGYENLIASLTLPDPNDRHVLAAAIVGRADVIVTRNLRDFPAAALDRYNITPLHPDQFVRHLIHLAPAVVVDAVRKQQASLHKAAAIGQLLGLVFRSRVADSHLG